MSSPPAPDGPVAESDMSATYLKVLAIELVVLAALYWLGVHFS